MRILVVVVVILFVLSTTSRLEAASTAKDFPLTGTLKCSFARQSVHIGVLIEGTMYELESAGQGPLIPGDYKLRVVMDKQWKPQQMDRVYEMLLPDGSTRKWTVSGIGAGVCGAASTL